MNERADYEAEVYGNLVRYVEGLDCECFEDCVSELEMEGEDPEECVPVIAQVFGVDEDRVWKEWTSCEQASADCAAERYAERRAFSY